MTDDVIASVIAEANKPVAAQEPNNNPEPKEDGAESEKAEGEGQGDQSDDVVFPKKALNALSKRDKKIGKLQAEIAALRAEREHYAPRAHQGQSQAQPQQNINASDTQLPKEEDYEDYGDYIAAKAEYSTLKKIAEQKQRADQNALSQAEAAKVAEWRQEKDAQIGETIQSYMKQIPDYEQVMREAADLAELMPEPIVKLFYEADDAALAIYNLAKEGKLERLANMSPYKAAVEIARAESIKPQPRKVTSSPEPIKGVSGANISGSKRIADMDGEELIAKLKIKY